MTAGYRTNLVGSFRCVGDVCPDTCCKGWDMQVNSAVAACYAKEENLKDKAIQNKDGSVIMRRDDASGFCVMLDKGWCGILKKHSDVMLGDACFFYPRSVRSFAGVPVISAALSCPESARIAISSDDAAKISGADLVRLPESMREYAPAGVSCEDVLAIMSAFQDLFLSSGHDFATASAIMASVAQSLEMLPVVSWKDAVPFYLRTGKDRLSAAEVADTDYLRLLQLLMVLKISYADMVKSERLDNVIKNILDAVLAEPDWKNGGIRVDDIGASKQRMAAAREISGKEIDLIVRRVMASQIVLFGFPFAGHGGSIYEKALLLIVRCCIIRLALVSRAAVDNEKINTEKAVEVIQPLARFLDHQAEAQAKLWLVFAEESEWLRSQRLAGLAGS